jgi:hypothetical protein
MEEGPPKIERSRKRREGKMEKGRSWGVEGRGEEEAWLPHPMASQIDLTRENKP